jgi:intracellular multiplication protein IcmD
MKLVISSNLKKKLGYLGLFSLFALAGVAFAQNNDPTLGSIANGMTSSFGSLTKFIYAACYICGTGLAAIGILKFKAHKENPTQTTLGVPLSFLGLGAAFAFMPTVLGATGATVFGPSRTATNFAGAGYNADLSSGNGGDAQQ